MVAINQTDIFNLGAHLDDRRRALDLQILDYRDRIAVIQYVAKSVFIDALPLSAFDGGIFRPFVRAFWADVIVALFVGEFRTA